MKKAHFKTKKEISKKPGRKRKSFSFLEGAWKGKSNFSLEEIKKAEIKFKEFSFADIDFCGMWSGREDMANSSQWVIKQRRKI